MTLNSRFKKLLRASVSLAVFFTAVLVAFSLGIEEKPWWQQAIGFLTGGSIGAIIGLSFFIFVGGIGFVSGAVFGAIGGLGLMIGGALGGMGLGSAVDKLIEFASDSGKFDVNVPVVTGVLALGLLAAYASYAALSRFTDSRPEAKSG